MDLVADCADDSQAASGDLKGRFSAFLFKYNVVFLQR